MILDPEGGCEEEAMALRSRDGVMVEGRPALSAVPVLPSDGHLA